METLHKIRGDSYSIYHPSRASLQRLSSADNSEQDGNDRNDEQDVYDSTSMQTKKPHCPCNDEYNGNDIKQISHNVLFKSFNKFIKYKSTTDHIRKRCKNLFKIYTFYILNSYWIWIILIYNKLNVWILQTIKVKV